MPAMTDGVYLGRLILGPRDNLELFRQRCGIDYE
jgi:hypothetical protein